MYAAFSAWSWHTSKCKLFHPLGYMSKRNHVIILFINLKINVKYKYTTAHDWILQNSIFQDSPQKQRFSYCAPLNMYPWSNIGQASYFGGGSPRGQETTSWRSCSTAHHQPACMVPTLPAAPRFSLVACQARSDTRISTRFLHYTMLRIVRWQVWSVQWTWHRQAYACETAVWRRWISLPVWETRG